MRTPMATLVVLALGAAVAAAQEPAETEEREPAPRPAIRVLQPPYDIASFYRSGESPLGPWAGLPADPASRMADFSTRVTIRLWATSTRVTIRLRACSWS